MEKQEIGRFYATRFDESVYEFIVNSDATMDCPAIGAESVYRIVIKPRFELFSRNCSFINPAKHGGHIDGLIRDYDIDDDLFDYLREHNMIMYSTDMAYLYGFKDKSGYDREFKEGHPFKWAEKKGPILVKQKNGQYN